MRVSLLLRWSGLAALVGVAAGLGSAGFLLALAWVTAQYQALPGLLFGLPAAGALIAWVYAGYGQPAAGGNNLILEHIHEPGERGVPLRMFPVVLFGTLLTHLFGGSAGREGTAVQMGGSLAATIGRLARLSAAETRLLLMAGISAGFGSVFGTPIAGAVFGMEVVLLGVMRYEALIPCLIAALAGDAVVDALGVAHSHYAVAAAPLLPALAIKLVLAGVLFGWASAAFAELAHAVTATSRRLLPRPVPRAAVGGALIVAITLGLGTRIYSGLSLPLLAQAFSPAGVPVPAFAIKLILTALTLGVGFKGGEVTPLFVIGATLGATLGRWLGAPGDFMAALGFIAVFAAAANTPMACVLMGVELFGASMLVPIAITTFVAYLASGHRGIYAAQRIHTPKFTIDGVDLVGSRLDAVRPPRKE
ncbi:MAG TPA: chloride channel protein [Herpetosiphonaceae bacterium]|nr:chloride channel protein [Herpetosiphonaceae bacterium]